jgi:hypothetical protein
LGGHSLDSMLFLFYEEQKSPAWLFYGMAA